MAGRLERELGKARAEQLKIGWSNSALALDAARRVRVAERALAASRGAPYAEVIDVGALWDTGAPLPHLVSNGDRAILVCRGATVDPSWDGSWSRMVTAADSVAELFLVMQFWGCASVRFGAPNDEALNGHALFGSGLQLYRAHEVRNSAWLEEHIAVNAVHPSHDEARWRTLNHFVLTFHDETFEALCRGMSVKTVEGTLADLLSSAAMDVVSGPPIPG